MSRANILLPHDPVSSFDSGQDQYEVAFAATNITALGDFDGIMMTSARSFKAWEKANGAGNDAFPFYVVEKATASNAQQPHP
ncbi:uncharacterized protein EV420DRAFT_1647026 [Desarmillaria tabescens]|uniref:Uncharacterized protein n=1 Tax=Armillaria tabescens TaxID=1929756 RepID=A0AA39JVH7_ARMTA|nr:uncharacterized protein EV420DRAFT_1647026 [Desarmillaria tabescens]KAK0449692.1 hypothetical protein EV420DRAFT_1647026 [Desarmillaria tabescens]